MTEMSRQKTYFRGKKGQKMTEPRLESRENQIFKTELFLFILLFKKIKYHNQLILILALSAARLSEAPGIDEPPLRALLI